MPTKVRSDEKEKSKQKILKSATKLFAQKGFDGVGIREICKDANANICMISYFLGREEADITKWVEYFINGMAIAFKSVYNKAKEQENSKDEIKVLRELDTKQRQILNLFETQKYVTSKDIAEFFKFSPRTARLLALEWVKAGFLIATGESKQRKYQLNEKYEQIL